LSAITNQDEDPTRREITNKKFGTLSGGLFGSETNRSSSDHRSFSFTAPALLKSKSYIVALRSPAQSRDYRRGKYRFHYPLPDTAGVTSVSIIVLVDGTK
jgi:hypothetical protein